MRVLIGNPAFRVDVGDGLERYLLGSGMRFPWSLLKHKTERPRYAMFPFFLAYTAAVLEEEGFEVHVIDAVPLNLGESEFESRVRSLQPDVVLLEPNTAVIDRVLAQAARLKASTGATVVLAGAHVSARPQEILERHNQVDFVIVGEYEIVARDLLRRLRDGKDVQELDGIGTRRRDGTVHVNKRAAPIEPLDSLPMPARHLFPSTFDGDLSLYRDGFCQYAPAFHMHTSRGCPFHCNFCVWVQVLYESGRQRFFSAARVVDEMQVLIDTYGAREIYIDDDNFTANPKHVIALCDEIMRRKMRVHWSAMADAIVLDEGLLGKMALAGCIGIKFGLDSADAGILDAVKKPLKLSRLFRVVQKAKKLGIKTHMTVVFGLTGETRRSMQATFAFACDLDIDSIQFSIATPCPGTSMYAQLELDNRLTTRRWEDFDGANRSVIAYDDFGRDFIEEFQARAHSRWLRAKLLSPRWMLRQLRYLSRIAQSQGARGLLRRFRRAVRLAVGDAMHVEQSGRARALRW